MDKWLTNTQNHEASRYAVDIARSLTEIVGVNFEVLPERIESAKTLNPSQVIILNRVCYKAGVPVKAGDIYYIPLNSINLEASNSIVMQANAEKDRMANLRELKTFLRVRRNISSEFDKNGKILVVSARDSDVQYVRKLQSLGVILVAETVSHRKLGSRFAVSGVDVEALKSNHDILETRNGGSGFVR